MKDIEKIIKVLSNLNEKQHSTLKLYSQTTFDFITNPQALIDLKAKLKCEEYLNFLSYLFFVCTVSTDGVSTLSPPKDNYFIHTLNIKQWLKNIKPLCKGKQGDIYSGTFLGEKVILKSPNKDSNTENIIKDYFNGIKCINKLRLECSMFTHTFGSLTIDKGLKEIWMVSEYIDGQTLKSIINTLTFEDFINLFFQILVALEIGQEDCEFCHYDLHTENVMVVESTEPSTYHIFKYDIIIDHKYKPKLIDFGMSSVMVNEGDHQIHVGQNNVTEYGIYPYLFTGYDPYIFLLFCKQVVTKKETMDGINTLLKFYGPSVTHSNYLETLKNNSGRFTPLMFIEYLKDNFMDHLMVEFKDRSVWKKAINLKYPLKVLAEHEGLNIPIETTIPSIKDLNEVHNTLATQDLTEMDNELLEKIHIFISALYNLSDKSNGHKIWLKKFKGSKVYKYYIRYYTAFTCNKRLN